MRHPAPILVTGSAGVIGRALVAALQADGVEVRGYDTAACGEQDVRDVGALRDAASGCRGIVHLAAVSRVAWAEEDPARCQAINVDGTTNAVDAASSCGAWLLFASSREVYGEPRADRIDEGFPRAPINVYGRSKADGEAAIEAARAHGLRAGVVRLTNVYGAPRDHPERVIPTFVRRARAGEPLRVDGADRTFDFVHLDDVIDALRRYIAALDRGDAPPGPFNIATGEGTSLGALARAVAAAAGRDAAVVERSSGAHEVDRFVGDVARAHSALGWAPRCSLHEGLGRLVASS